MPAFISVRGIGQGWIEKGGFPENGAVVTEGVEAELAVIGTHAAVPHTAEGKTRVQKMHDGIIDASAARGSG